MQPHYEEQSVDFGLDKYLGIYFSNVERHSETRKEINYVIPRSDTGNFKGFFESFDKKLQEFKIKSYGVSMTTLEEVFLKINMKFAPELFGECSNPNSKAG